MPEDLESAKAAHPIPPGVYHGTLDVFVVGHAGNVLYRNDGPVGGWLELDLVGVSSNRSAIGATATLRAPRTRPNRTVEGSSGAYGQDSLTLEFGLASRPGPFTVAVRWPSGATQTVTGIGPDQHLVITEPGGRGGT